MYVHIHTHAQSKAALYISRSFKTFNLGHDLITRSKANESSGSVFVTFFQCRSMKTVFLNYILSQLLVK